MVTIIGIVIGCYVLTRSLSMVFSKGERAESGAVKVFAIITILVTIFGIGELIVRGQVMSDQMNKIDHFFKYPLPKLF